MKAKSERSWLDDGLRFQCQGSGKCCVSHGEFGFVYMTLEDRQRMAKTLGLSTGDFTRKHCDKTDGVFHLKEDSLDAHGVPKGACRFLKDRKCQVYEGRPTQCRTWPFWPEMMSAKAWREDVVSFCPGVGRGDVISKNEIEAILADQKKSETELFGDAAQHWAANQDIPRLKRGKN